MAGAGIMLCGTSTSWQTNFLAELLGLSGLGADRRAVDATTNADASSGWGKVIYSCLSRLRPFRATIAFNSNQDWKTLLNAAKATWTVTWPVESGYTTAATLAWSCACTGFTFGGMLEERMLAEVEITPTGAPTITAGS